MTTRVIFNATKPSRFVLLLGLVLASATVGQGPQPVVFVHGLFGTGNDWIVMPNYVASHFNVQVFKPTLGWQGTYESQAANLQGALAGQDDAVAISHSNGSMVTRRYLSSYGVAGSRINRHLTIGGLHRGAELAANVRNGQLVQWLGGFGTAIIEPLQVYVFDPVFAQSGNMQLFESQLTDFANGVLGHTPQPQSLPSRILQLGFDVTVPVLEQMDPSSSTFASLNSPSGLAAEAAATTSQGRASIGTRTNGDLLPWSLFTSRENALDIRTWSRRAAYIAAVLYVYYLNSPDPYLAGNAWMWARLYWYLELVPVSWASQIGALLVFAWNQWVPGYYAAAVEAHDGLLPLVSTQQYVGGTRTVEIFGDILHGEQRSNEFVLEATDDVLRTNFQVQPTQPPPTSNGVSVDISGPTQGASGQPWVGQAIASGGGGGYQYVWLGSMNGAPQAYLGSNQTQVISFPTCGSALIRVEVIAQDSTGDMSEIPVSVACSPLVASLTGPTEISPTATCSWTAGATGGTPGYTYRWYRNGILVSTGSDYTAGMNGDPSFTLLLEATDAATASDADQVVVSNTGFGECLLT